jgi:periplasmic protein CpxP/Spy
MKELTGSTSPNLRSYPMTMNLISTLTQRFGSIKQMPLLAGALAIAIGASTVAPSFAQSPLSGQMAQAQGEQKQGKWKNLNLTDAQKAQMKSLRESTKSQIEAILTADQKAKLQAAKGDRSNRRQVWQSLNLTDAQKAQMKQIRAAAKQQMETILTPEQRQQMQQMRQRNQQPGV